MDKIKLEKNMDIIDYIAEHNEECVGRKVFTDADMFRRLKGLTDSIETQGKNAHLNIICPETGNITEVDIVREGSNCYWVKDVRAIDIKSIAPVDVEKNAIQIINEKTFDFDKY